MSRMVSCFEGPRLKTVHGDPFGTLFPLMLNRHPLTAQHHHHTVTLPGNSKAVGRRDGSIDRRRCPVRGGTRTFSSHHHMVTNDRKLVRSFRADTALAARSGDQGLAVAARKSFTKFSSSSGAVSETAQ